MDNDKIQESDEKFGPALTKHPTILHYKPSLLPGERSYLNLIQVMTEDFSLLTKDHIYPGFTINGCVFIDPDPKIFRQSKSSSAREPVEALYGGSLDYSVLSASGKLPQIPSWDHSFPDCGINFTDFDSRLLVTSRRSSY
ncbi:MAG: hypothetical protein Ct9H300mP19_15670 [Dehalococcoidia bacterium]|nr:MAG: hypothetical protein Ct9H300mP19_15670 [Dehalococcoidia bacterium]